LVNLDPTKDQLWQTSLVGFKLENSTGANIDPSAKLTDVNTLKIQNNMWFVPFTGAKKNWETPVDSFELFAKKYCGAGVEEVFSNLVRVT